MDEAKFDWIDELVRRLNADGIRWSRGKVKATLLRAARVICQSLHEGCTVSLGDNVRIEPRLTLNPDGGATFTPVMVVKPPEEAEEKA